MSLDFTAIKAIPIADVLRRYNISLTMKGQWGSAVCPLPTHKEGDKSKSFTVNLQGNFWRCFSESCNANNGGKRGGDVVNFVALMDGISQLDAAKKLADMFHIGQIKTASHIEKPSVAPIEKPHAKDCIEPTIPTGNLKYMQEVEAWFYALVVRGNQETDVDYWARILKSVKSRLVESYRTGQKQKVA
jgi:hypothetical protein